MPRVNKMQEDHGSLYEKDIEAIFLGPKASNHHYIDGIMLPKCDSVEDLMNCSNDL